MQKLIYKLKKIQKSEINNIIESRLEEFESFKNKSDDEWFSELCFCILAANARQKTSAAIQAQINHEGFKTLSQETLSNLIKINKHRFHNNKSKYIVAARNYLNIKSILSEKTEEEAREWLVKNVKGIGYKEASHFLRNTGSQNLAILDRHIINLLADNEVIEKPKALNAKNYREIEKKFNLIAKKLKISPARLDLMMWYIKNGEVAK